MKTKKFIKDWDALLKKHGIKKVVMSSDAEGNNFHTFGGVELLPGCLVMWPEHDDVDPYNE